MQTSQSSPTDHTSARTTHKPRRTRNLLGGTSAAALLILAACGGNSQGGDEAGGTEETGGSLADVPSYAVTSPLVPPQVPPYLGPLVSGQDFGLEMSTDDLQVLNDTPTALQLLLSGELDISSVAFLNFLQAREGQPQLRAFCPEQSTTNAVIVSTNPDVTELADLDDQSLDVLVESPGGPNDYFMNEALDAADVDFRVADLTNTLIVENMEQRFTTLASRNADAGVVWNYDVADLEEAVGADQVTVLADFTDNPSMYLAYVSTEEWLSQNPDTAAAFCASVLKTNRDLSADIESYRAVLDEYAEGDPPDRQIEMTWEAANQSSMWPHEGGLAPEDVEPMLQSAVDNGLLQEPLAYEDVVDTAAFDRALQLLAEDS